MFDDSWYYVQHQGQYNAENIVGFIGLLISAALAALRPSNHPKIKGCLLSFGLVCLFFGAIAYIASIQRILRESARNCLHNGGSNNYNDDLPCYYGLYFLMRISNCCCISSNQ